MTKTITYCDICGEEVNRDDFIACEAHTKEQKRLAFRAKNTELKTIIEYPGSGHKIDMCFGCSVALLMWIDGRRHKEDI